MPSSVRSIVVDDTDTRIQYTGHGWFQDSARGAEGFRLNTRHGTNRNDSFAFSFTGTSFSVRGATGLGPQNQTWDPKWECFIDGVSTGPTHSHAASSSQQICQADGLTDGHHLFTLNVTTTGNIFWFDQLQFTPSSPALLVNRATEALVDIFGTPDASTVVSTPSISSSSSLSPSPSSTSTSSPSTSTSTSTTRSSSSTQIGAIISAVLGTLLLVALILLFYRRRKHNISPFPSTALPITAPETVQLPRIQTQFGPTQTPVRKPRMAARTDDSLSPLTRSSETVSARSPDIGGFHSKSSMVPSSSRSIVSSDWETAGSSLDAARHTLPRIVSGQVLPTGSGTNLVVRQYEDSGLRIGPGVLNVDVPPVYTPD